MHAINLFSPDNLLSVYRPFFAILAVAKSRGEYLPTHFKNMCEVASALTGMKLSKAFNYLSDVKEHKQCIPYTRFAGSIGRARQAKAFKTTRG